MALLNYEVLKNSGYDGYILENAPEKVMQFGEGNFLRAFVDYFFDVANEKADWNGNTSTTSRDCIRCTCVAARTAKRWMRSASSPPSAAA